MGNGSTDCKRGRNKQRADNHQQVNGEHQGLSILRLSAVVRGNR